MNRREEVTDKRQHQQQTGIGHCTGAPLVGKLAAEEDGCSGRGMLFNLESSRLYRIRRNGGGDRTSAPAGSDPAGSDHGDDDVRKATSFEPLPTTTDGTAANASKHYTLPGMPAPCSLLESYVTGTGSPLRNLYCQCKHHHDALQ
uniref:Uncharacterized protein n=1 Tax=Anopheles atroparvus TaxID=41427 RepID=A0A182JJ96_ANOAO